MILEKIKGGILIEPHHILLALFCFDVTIEGWFSIWYLKIFIELIDAQFISFNSILSSALGIFTMYVVIKRYEKPSPTILVMCTLISYLGLLGLIFSPSIFLISSTLLGTVLGAVSTSFRNNITAQNVPSDYRAKYDNWQTFLTKISIIIGSSIAYFTIAESVAYWKIWIMTFMLFDLDLMVKLILIKKGIIKYEY